ncbi:MAG: type II toxin-antitoxin system HicB family antitoxin [Firmicutes bacterium]|nr:type II toxin-antitoxin system HicB family antitoxin [Bacillota bacterium]
MKDYYVFPARLFVDTDGVSVDFPDLPGCITCGDTEEEALKNAKEALALHLYGMEQDGDPIPEPSKIKDLKSDEGQIYALVEVWMVPFRDKMANKAEKITTTIPRWLKSIGDERGISYSDILQKALKEYLGVSESNLNRE